MNFCTLSSSFVIYHLGSSDQTVVSVDISLGSSIRHEPPIHKTYFCYQRTDWDPFLDFLYDAHCSEIFHLPIENCATEVSSWVKADIDAFMPSWKYQVKL